MRQMKPVHIFHHTSRWFILIISSHLHLGLSHVLFPLVFPTKILYAFLISPFRDLIVVFTRTRHRFLSWTRRIRSTSSHSTHLRFITILSSHLYLGHSGVLFPSGFTTNIFYAFLMSSVRVTCPRNIRYEETGNKGCRWSNNLLDV